jgi:hypothetical protein
VLAPGFDAAAARTKARGAEGERHVLAPRIVTIKHDDTAAMLADIFADVNFGSMKRLTLNSSSESDRVMRHSL